MKTIINLSTFLFNLILGLQQIVVWRPPLGEETNLFKTHIWNWNKMRSRNLWKCLLKVISKSLIT